MENEIENSHQVTIRSPYRFNGTTVEIDGQKIEHVRTVRFEHVAGDMPRLTIELIPRGMDFAGLCVEVTQRSAEID